MEDMRVRIVFLMRGCNPVEDSDAVEVVYVGLHSLTSNVNKAITFDDVSTAMKFALTQARHSVELNNNDYLVHRVEAFTTQSVERIV